MEDKKDKKDPKPGLNKKPHNKKKKPKKTCIIVETTSKKEQKKGIITIRTLRALHKQCHA